MISRLFVPLLALALSAGVTSRAIAQSSTVQPTVQPALQKGVSVEMARTTNATPMPEADDARALVVTVTDSGSIYFGVDPITPAALTDKLKASLANRQRKFYLKADARAPYSDVMKVLGAALAAGIGLPMLLTAQQESSEPGAPATGAVMSPKGLSVLIAADAPAGLEKIAAEKVVVWAFKSAQHEPTLTVNGQATPWSELLSALTQLQQNRSEKMIVVKADGSLPYAQVVRVIDLCQSTGAKVLLTVMEI